MDDETLAPGTEFAGYRIERYVARGGMGQVYEATHLALDRRVALKLITPRLGLDDRFRDRFRREAKAAALIDHANILPVYDAGEDPQGRLFLATRFIDGPDLSSLLKEQGPLNVEQAIPILLQIGEALDAAHERGLVHRDVKPANVMLERVNDGWHAYLTDFGLAKPTDQKSEHTVSGEVLGTVDYMAPEVINGATPDSRIDVYSFGCMVYRCLTGELPYKRDSSTATMIAHVNAPIPVPSEAIGGVPAPLDFVVTRAMEKDPEQRARSAGSLMRWAQAQLDTAAPTADSVATEESPTTETEILSANTELVELPEREPEASSAGGSRFGTRVLIHLAAYAPLWAGAYFVGRSL